MPLTHAASGDAADGNNDLLTTHRSPKSASANPKEQDDSFSIHIRSLFSTLITQSKEILCRILKHGWYCMVLTVQLCLLPLAILFRRSSASQYWPLGFANAEEGLQNADTDLSENATTPDILLQNVVWLWVQAIDVARILMELYQRLDQIANLLEDHRNNRRTVENMSVQDGGSVAETDSQESPFISPATASQVYHAALADNQTLDNLLAAFDGKGTSLLPEFEVGRSDSGVESASVPCSTISEADVQLPVVSISESQGKASKFSVKASPTWATRLGYVNNNNNNNNNNNQLKAMPDATRKPCDYPSATKQPRVTTHSFRLYLKETSFEGVQALTLFVVWHAIREAPTLSNWLLGGGRKRRSQNLETWLRVFTQFPS